MNYALRKSWRLLDLCGFCLKTLVWFQNKSHIHKHKIIPLNKEFQFSEVIILNLYVFLRAVMSTHKPYSDGTGCPWGRQVKMFHRHTFDFKSHLNQTCLFFSSSSLYNLGKKWWSKLPSGFQLTQRSSEKSNPIRIGMFVIVAYYFSQKFYSFISPDT